EDLERQARSCRAGIAVVLDQQVAPVEPLELDGTPLDVGHLIEIEMLSRRYERRDCAETILGDRSDHAEVEHPVVELRPWEQLEAPTAEAAYSADRDERRVTLEHATAVDRDAR